MSSDQIKDSGMRFDSNNFARVGAQVSPAPSKVVLGVTPDVTPFAAVLPAGPRFTFQKLSADLVCVTWSEVVAQSTTAGALITWTADVPAAYRPVDARYGYIGITNADVVVGGRMLIGATGDITIGTAAGAALTGTDNGGFASGSMVYSLGQQ